MQSNLCRSLLNWSCWQGTKGMLLRKSQPLRRYDDFGSISQCGAEGSANAVNVSPPVVTTHCLPSSRYVTAAEPQTCAPT